MVPDLRAKPAASLRAWWTTDIVVGQFSLNPPVQAYERTNPTGAKDHYLRRHFEPELKPVLANGNSLEAAERSQSPDARAATSARSAAKWQEPEYRQKTLAAARAAIFRNGHKHDPRHPALRKK